MAMIVPIPGDFQTECRWSYNGGAFVGGGGDRRQENDKSHGLTPEALITLERIPGEDNRKRIGKKCL